MYFVTVVHMFWFSNINFIILLCIINFYSFFLVFHSIYNKYKKGNNRARRHMLRYHRWTDMSWCFFIFFYSSFKYTHTQEYRYSMSSQVKVQIMFMYLHSQRSSLAIIFCFEWWCMGKWWDTMFQYNKKKKKWLLLILNDAQYMYACVLSLMNRGVNKIKSNIIQFFAFVRFDEIKSDIINGILRVFCAKYNELVVRKACVWVLKFLKSVLFTFISLKILSYCYTAYLLHTLIVHSSSAPHAHSKKNHDCQKHA